VERRCINELLRRIDERKVRDEAYVGNRRGKRKGRWEKQARHGGTDYEVRLWRKNEGTVKWFLGREDERGLERTRFKG
jgi:hypothetical protein